MQITEAAAVRSQYSSMWGVGGGGEGGVGSFRSRQRGKKNKCTFTCLWIQIQHNSGGDMRLNSQSFTQG